MRALCRVCDAPLPTIPPALPRHWSSAPWPVRRRRRLLMHRLVLELRRHRAGRCELAEGDEGDQ